MYVIWPDIYTFLSHTHTLSNLLLKNLGWVLLFYDFERSLLCSTNVFYSSYDKTVFSAGITSVLSVT